MCVVCCCDFFYGQLEEFELYANIINKKNLKDKQLQYKDFLQVYVCVYNK